MNKRKFFLLFLIFLFTDVFIYFLSVLAAYAIREQVGSFFGALPLELGLTDFATYWWVPVIIAVFLLSTGTYTRKQPFWIEAGNLVKGLILSFAVSMAVVSLGHMSGVVSRLLICLLWLIMFFTVPLGRAFVKRFIFSRHYFMDNAVLIGNSSEFDNVIKAFEKEKYMGIRIVKTFSTHDCNHSCDIDNSDDIDFIIGKNYDVAVIIASQNTGEKEKELSARIQKSVSRFYIIPDSSMVNLTNSTSGQILSYQLGYLSVENSLKSPISRLCKRFFDLGLTIILIPFIIPVIAILAQLVKRDSPGSAFFSHTRIGRDGKPFKVYKLRSMYSDAAQRLEKLLSENPALKDEWEQNFKLKNDPRVTKVGNFLRKTSLDELPQFFNVMLGNMSFVGPRPVLQKEIDMYYKDDKFYYYMATPGITGIWQVSGRSDTTYKERVALDCWYVFNWSLWLDIVIIFSTPVAVILRRGAY